MKIKKKYVWISNEEDISKSCIHCGSKDVVLTRAEFFQYAPFWATYLGGIGMFRFIYRHYKRTASLKVGYCKKHRSNTFSRYLKLILMLGLGGVLIAYGIRKDQFIYQFIGGVFLMSSLFVSKIGNIAPVKKIDDEKICIKVPVEI